MTSVKYVQIGDCDFKLIDHVNAILQVEKIRGFVGGGAQVFAIYAAAFDVVKAKAVLRHDATVMGYRLRIYGESERGCRDDSGSRYGPGKNSVDERTTSNAAQEAMAE